MRPREDPAATTPTDRRGTVIVFSGALASGTGALSKGVSERLGWPTVRFSDHIRRLALAQGKDANDVGTLQRIGQQLVRERRQEFVAAVLALGGWSPGGDLVIDGLRHVEIYIELKRQVGEGADVHVVHTHLSKAERAANASVRSGIDELTFEALDGHVTEAQVEQVLPEYADIDLNGAKPLDELVEFVLERFGRPSRAPDDFGESVSSMEPLLLASDSRHRAGLSALATELLAASKDFTAELPVSLRRPLGDVVRAMNCYYSNLIEGHVTHPVEIERALRKDYSPDEKRRDLQREAEAHIAVQAWLDGGGLAGREATSVEALKTLHERFCAALPNDMRWALDPTTGARWRVVPGEFRRRDVRVGWHEPPSPGSVERFMRRFEIAYARLGLLERVLASAAAHHRLLWIHPFLDGNGRVTRLMSHVMLTEALGHHGLWSVARGLAREVDAYKGHLAACDLPKRNDLDGRGALSEEALAAFTRFFLERCIDQVTFMRGLMDLTGLQARLRLWVEEQACEGVLPPSALRLLSQLLTTSFLRRSEALRWLDIPVEEGEAALARLADLGLLRMSDVDVLEFSFPAELSARLLPGLFPAHSLPV